MRYLYQLLGSNPFNGFSGFPMKHEVFEHQADEVDCRDLSSSEPSKLRTLRAEISEMRSLQDDMATPLLVRQLMNGSAHLSPSLEIPFAAPSFVVPQPVSTCCGTD
eukprot:m.96772 g.96772  ORF g.96772 m.96772 type:complete len:106 (-) comp51330_c0_seq5:183-500(-)